MFGHLFIALITVEMIFAAFGQSSSSPFGSQSVFGQTNNASSNPFAPKPFGSTTPFGSQTGSSFFGSTSTGVFGNTGSSPLGSTSVFGASSSPAFGASAPAFGASSSSSPAFGNLLLSFETLYASESVDYFLCVLYFASAVVCMF